MATAGGGGEVGDKREMEREWAVEVPGFLVVKDFHVLTVEGPG